ncbi:DUF4387 family protein [Streptomyces sp. NPDC010273]|uniref:DUF4387 family protein n=1 Tax=Streptomyces sp. NPDC010273 TaxID=3364829 RepID=UPI0036E11558
MRLPQPALLRHPLRHRSQNILVVDHPLALAVKVSLPRPTVQGGPHDSDCYAGRQYASLMDMDIGPA